MNWYVPIVLIGVILVVTLLLILASVALGNGGEKIININNKVKIPVTGEDTLLNTLSQNKIFIPSACGGKATCGLCKCKVISGGGEVKPTELPI
ncbi:MAG: 2Fe-2S iron-sulfur cluster-binding protein [Bacillus subtilis]|nr:2Fe-2S iron-sulfur cluster-binding protein [Bacillus subtilis]